MLPGKAISVLVGALLDLVYPAHCPVCRVSLGPGELRICPSCWGDLELIRGNHCGKCGCPARLNVPICDNCAEKGFRFESLRSLAPFTDPLQHLIHGLKYQGRTTTGRILGKRLGELLQEDGSAEDIDLLVPVPLHPSRRRERGYNQSGIVAKAVSGVLDRPVEEKAVRRVRATPTQTALDLPGRAANVAGAFRVKRPEAIKGKRILLVDDVVTTGATANACTDALLEAGAEGVWVVALASPYHEKEEAADSG